MDFFDDHQEYGFDKVIPEHGDECRYCAKEETRRAALVDEAVEDYQLENTI